MDWRRALQAAVSLHQAGRPGEAAPLYRFVLQQQPQNDDALHLLGMALEQLGDPAQGRPLLEQAIALNPQAADYHNSLGNICRALHDDAAAMAAYRHALQLDPHHPEAHNNLGMMAQAQGDWAAARMHFNAARQAMPGMPEAAFNLAVTDWLSGAMEPAMAAFDDLLRQHPDMLRRLFHLARQDLERKALPAAERLIAFLDNKGLAAFEWQYLQAALADLRGDLDAAERKYSAVLAIKPDHGEALRKLGRVLLDRQKPKEAIPLLERAQQLQAGEKPETAILLAWAYNEAGKHQRSAEMFEAILGRYPDNLGMWLEYAQTLLKMERPREAADAYRHILTLNPDRDTAEQIHANLASAEIRRDQLEEAEAACRQALAINPESRRARGNLANIRELQKRYDEAERLYRDLLRSHPDDPDAHNNLGVMLLQLGRYAEAWPHFAWRSRSSGWTSPDSSHGLPRWDGTFPPPGRLLVWREQGIGDEILFASLLPELQARGADVVVAPDRRLVPLFSRSFPGITFVPHESVDPAALGLACQRPFADLGAILRPDAESFARHPAGYLKIDTARREEFRRRYGAAGRLLVGLSWTSGNRRTGSSKSIALSDLAPVMREPDAVFVSLQYGGSAAEAAPFAQATGLPLRHDADVDPLQDIDAQAAQIAALDLVVTVSTAAAHLAGGLGVPTLLLLPATRGQLWYWGADGERTPWYPPLRICRALPGEAAEALVHRALTAFRQMREGLGRG